MQHQRRSPADSEIESWHWLVDAVAEEIAAGAPQDARVLVLRLAERLKPGGLDAYLPMLFADPD